MTFQDLRITNAGDLSDTDFACVQDFDMKITMLNAPAYTDAEKVLILSPIDKSVL